MVTGARVLMPVIVMLAEAAHSPRVALTLLSNWNASGVVSAANVVALNVAEIPPTVRTALAAVENWLEAVTRIWSLCPLATVPAAEVKAPPLIEYSPPVIETAAFEFKPATVISLDVMTADSAVPV